MLTPTPKTLDTKKRRNFTWQTDIRSTHSMDSTLALLFIEPTTWTTETADLLSSRSNRNTSPATITSPRPSMEAPSSSMDSTLWRPYPRCIPSSMTCDSFWIRLSLFLNYLKSQDKLLEKHKDEKDRLGKTIKTEQFLLLPMFLCDYKNLNGKESLKWLFFCN